MSQSLEEFASEVRNDLQGFVAEYQAQHAINPEQFPLVLSDDNTGLWLEFFVDYMTREST